MEFDFDDVRYEFRDAVRRVLEAECSPKHLRSAWEAGHDYTSSLWPRLAALGLPAMAVPQEYGGAGGDLVDLVLLLEVCGYYSLPEPVVETAVLAPVLLSAFGDQARKATWLPQLAEGRSRVAHCVGDAGLVPDGLSADAVLVQHSGELHWVPRSGVRGTPVRSADPTRRLARCEFTLDASTLLTGDPRGVALAADLGASGTATLLVGLSQRLTDMTRDYMLERRQFGRVIGGFQALKHRMADVAVQTEAARSLTWYAAYAVSHGTPDASVASSMAKASANEAAFLANYASLQHHGGIGFTWEHDLHLWLQRGKALETSFGSTVEHRALVADRVLAEVWA